MRQQVGDRAAVDALATQVRATKERLRRLEQRSADTVDRPTRGDKIYRPEESNDNPFSEIQFKTLKHRPDFPAA